MSSVVIAGFKRSPFTFANKGALSKIRPEDLLSQVINDLVNDSKFYDNYPEDKVFFGEYTNSLLKSGYVKRETFIKKNKSGKTKNVFSCRLNEI